MALDVETPDPPDLTNRGLPGAFDTSEEIESVNELRREELETVLRDGAWDEAFREWAAYTDMTREEYETARDSGLFEALDFYWDPTEERIRFEVPDVDEWPDVDFTPETRTELSDLCDVVVEMLEEGYVDWGEEASTDPVWGEEALGEEHREY